jgi:hypothetical protein
MVKNSEVEDEEKIIFAGGCVCCRSVGDVSALGCGAGGLVNELLV